MRSNSRRFAGLRRSWRGGFTLIELLVVIGIIAMLIGILIPALSRAREAANTTACLANLRSITLAIRNYTADYDNYPVPVSCTDNIYWYNILVDKRYLSAPDAAGKGPQTRSVFYCPGGSTVDLLSPALSGVTNIPASRTDMYGAMAVRFQSPDTHISVDCWYGMSADESSSLTSGFPARKTADGSTDVMIKMNAVTRASETALLYDGVFWHLGGVNANRLNARHMFKTRTNLSFFDGHAQTFRTADLPGGIGIAQTGDFSLPSLQANRKGGAPLWLLEQQR